MVPWCCRVSEEGRGEGVSNPSPGGGLHAPVMEKEEVVALRNKGAQGRC